MGLVEFHRYEHTASSTKWPPFVRYFHMHFPDENMSFDSNSLKFALEGPIEQVNSESGNSLVPNRQQDSIWFNVGKMSDATCQ